MYDMSHWIGEKTADGESPVPRMFGRQHSHLERDSHVRVDYTFGDPFCDAFGEALFVMPLVIWETSFDMTE